MDEAKRQKLAKALAFKANPLKTFTEENEKVIQAIEEIKNDSQKIVEAIGELDNTKASKKELEIAVSSVEMRKGDRGFKGEKGDKGDRGEKGDKGDTVIVDKIIEKTEVIREIPIVTENIVEKITEEVSGETIIKRINENKKDLIKREKVEGLEDIARMAEFGATRPIQGVGGGSSGIRDIRAGSGISVSKINEVYTIGLNYTPTDTDEKVKYDASDPTAGYIADKFVAGTGITLSEGTGADENKLKVINSAPDQTVAITAGTNITSVTGTYPNFTINADTQTTDISGKLNIDQTTPQAITATDTTITASDEIYFGDATDTGKFKKDTVQGIIDLIPAPDLSAYAKLDGTNQPFTGDLTIAHTTGDGVTPVKMILNSTTDGTWTIGSIFAEYDMHSSDTSGGGSGIRVALKGITETALGQQNGLAIYTTQNGPGGLLERIRISGAGNVRIGSGIPSVDFEINKNGGADCRYVRASTTYRSTFQMYTGSSQDFIIGTQTGDSDLYILRGLSGAPYSQSIFRISKSTGDIYLPLDSQKLFFGAGSDCYILYDGTNMVVNPKAVGTGILDVTGVLQTDGYNSADGTAGITTTFVDDDGNTIGVKDGLVVSKTAP